MTTPSREETAVLLPFRKPAGRPAGPVSRDVHRDALLGPRELYVERDADGDPSFALAVQAVQFVGLQAFVDLRAWQANDEGVPPTEVQHLLTAAEARQLAALLLTAADHAEAAS